MPSCSVWLNEADVEDGCVDGALPSGPSTCAVDGCRQSLLHLGSFLSHFGAKCKTVPINRNHYSYPVRPESHARTSDHHFTSPDPWAVAAPPQPERSGNVQVSSNRADVGASSFAISLCYVLVYAVPCSAVQRECSALFCSVLFCSAPLQAYLAWRSSRDAQHSESIHLFPFLLALASSISMSMGMGYGIWDRGPCNMALPNLEVNRCDERADRSQDG
ncbi:hypothetical protein BD289DRAFT_88698 [Coniella lustricola]|uniref:Uncharacterized protein n=1 Tax=Coniella lustricola TaxID=2025994 RepID=A0A2T2ZYM8_9PEZI|nr:hypothetical protein BD289DRAFT_88698 [Coniella lustricola]